MPALKTIQINPEALSIGNKKTRKNRQKLERKKKKKTSSHIKPNTLKKALLRRIKEKAHKEKQKMDESKTDKTNDDTFSTEFEKHLSYLNNLSIQQKHKKKSKNKTLKTKSNAGVNNIAINTELPPELTEPTKPSISTTPFTLNPPKSPEPPSTTFVKPTIVHTTNTKPPPPYSCLKGGNKPTYREWKKLTQKNMDSFGKKEDKSSDDDENSKIDEIRARILDNNKKFERKPTSKIYRKKTIKRRYKFGKNNGKISVLVKNNKTRKMVQNEVELLRRAPIKEIKEYLRKHYLYKAGSNAPNDVLRKTYIDAHLSGEITNKSTETLVHNYINN